MPNFEFFSDVKKTNIANKKVFKIKDTEDNFLKVLFNDVLYENEDYSRTNGCRMTGAKRPIFIHQSVKFNHLNYYSKKTFGYALEGWVEKVA